MVLHLVDKYGNDLERGEVRVEAKIFGSKASDVEVVGLQNGLFSIGFTASRWPI